MAHEFDLLDTEQPKATNAPVYSHPFDLLDSPPSTSTLGAYGSTIKQAIKGIPAYVGSAIEGATPYNEQNALDEIQATGQTEQQAFENQPNANTPVLGGLAKAKDIYQTAPSLSGSIAGMAPAALGTAIGSLAGPIGAGIGGLVGSGVGLLGMKRAAENQFVKQNIDKANQDRAALGQQPLTNEEAIAKQDELNASGDTTKIGYSEAVPETLGNAAEIALMRTPLGQVGKAIGTLASPITRALATGGVKLGASMATEAGEEEVTRQLQNPVMVDRGFPEQGALDTLKQTAIATLPFGAVAGGVGAYQGYKSSGPLGNALNAAIPSAPTQEQQPTILGNANATTTQPSARDVDAESQLRTGQTDAVSTSSFVEPTIQAGLNGNNTIINASRDGDESSRIVDSLGGESTVSGEDAKQDVSTGGTSSRQVIGDASRRAEEPGTETDGQNTFAQDLEGSGFTVSDVNSFLDELDAQGIDVNSLSDNELYNLSQQYKKDKNVQQPEESLSTPIDGSSVPDRQVRDGTKINAAPTIDTSADSEPGSETISDGIVSNGGRGFDESNNKLTFTATHYDPNDGEEFMKLPDGRFITQDQFDNNDYDAAIPFADGTLEQYEPTQTPETPATPESKAQREDTPAAIVSKPGAQREVSAESVATGSGVVEGLTDDQTKNPNINTTAPQEGIGTPTATNDIGQGDGAKQGLETPQIPEQFAQDKKLKNLKAKIQSFADEGNADTHAIATKAFNKYLDELNNGRTTRSGGRVQVDVSSDKGVDGTQPVVVAGLGNNKSNDKNIVNQDQGTAKEELRYENPFKGTKQEDEDRYFGTEVNLVAKDKALSKRGLVREGKAIIHNVKNNGDVVEVQFPDQDFTTRVSLSNTYDVELLNKVDKFEKQEEAKQTKQSKQPELKSELPKLGTFTRDKAFIATAEGQKYLARRGERTSLLTRLNEQAGNPYNHDAIVNMADENIDTVRDYLINLYKEKKLNEQSGQKQTKDEKEKAGEEAVAGVTELPTLITDSAFNKYVIKKVPTDKGTTIYEIFLKRKGYSSDLAKKPIDRKFHKLSISTTSHEGAIRAIHDLIAESKTKVMSNEQADESMLEKKTNKKEQQTNIKKQNHQKTLDEYTKERALKKLPKNPSQAQIDGNAYWAKEDHKVFVRNALLEGKEVSPEVLKDYTELLNGSEPIEVNITTPPTPLVEEPVKPPLAVTTTPTVKAEKINPVTKKVTSKLKTLQSMYEQNLEGTNGNDTAKSHAKNKAEEAYQEQIANDVKEGKSFTRTQINDIADNQLEHLLPRDDIRQGAGAKQGLEIPQIPEQLTGNTILINAQNVVKKYANENPTDEDKRRHVLAIKKFNKLVESETLKHEQSSQEQNENEEKTAGEEAGAGLSESIQDYTERKLNESRYRKSYESDPERLKEFKDSAKAEWQKEVESATERLPDHVIDEYVDNYGMTSLQARMRGVHEKAIEGWMPKDIREQELPKQKERTLTIAEKPDYERTWPEQREEFKKGFNADRKITVAEFKEEKTRWLASIEKAKLDGKITSPNILNNAENTNAKEDRDTGKQGENGFVNTKTKKQNKNTTEGDVNGINGYGKKEDGIDKNLTTHPAPLVEESIDLEPTKEEKQAVAKSYAQQADEKKNHIVLNEGNGKVINDLYRQWNSIKTKEDSDKFKRDLVNTKFGTYGTLPFHEVLAKFEPKFPNDITEKAFTEETKKILKNPDLYVGKPLAEEPVEPPLPFTKHPILTKKKARYIADEHKAWIKEHKGAVQGAKDNELKKIEAGYNEKLLEEEEKIRKAEDLHFATMLFYAFKELPENKRFDDDQNLASYNALREDNGLAPVINVGSKQEVIVNKEEKPTDKESLTVKEPKEIEHAGYRIYPIKIKDKDYFAVETVENKERRLAGDRNRGGDLLYESLDAAKKSAEQDAEIKKANAEYDKKYQEQKAQKAQEDLEESKDKAIREDTDGYADSLPALQKGKAISALNKKVRINDKVDTIKNHVRHLIEQGEKPSTYEENKIKDVSRVAWNRMDQRQQDAHTKKVKEGGKKTVYQVGGYELGKIAHDYAQHLINLQEEPTNAKQEQKASGPNEGGSTLAGVRKKGEDTAGSGGRVPESGSGVSKEEKVTPTKTPDIESVTGDYYVDYFLDSFSKGIYKNTLNTENNEDYANAARLFLSENLADKAKPKGLDGIELVKQLNNIVPKSTPKKITKIKDNFESISKALLPFMGSGDVRYYLNGIAIDDIDNKLFASNGHTLAIVNSIPEGTPTGNPHYSKEEEIKYPSIERTGVKNIYNRYAIDKDKATGTLTGTETWIDGKFPSFKGAIDNFKNADSYNIALENLSGIARGMLAASKFIEGKYIKEHAPVTLTDGKSTLVVRPDYLSNAVNLVRGFGYESANVKITPQGVSIESEDGKVQTIVMSMRDDSGDLFKPYDIKQAEYAGDKYAVIPDLPRFSKADAIIEDRLYDAEDKSSYKLFEKQLTRDKNKKPTEAMVRHTIARHNAALPTQQGGLGLPANNTAFDRAKAMGASDFYHGTQRLDRVLQKKELIAKRATSGPMPFGTDTQSIASNYATGKPDTSNVDEQEDVSAYFTVTPKQLGERGTVPYTVERTWFRLTPEQKETIKERATRVGYENIDEATGPFVLHPEGVDASLSSSHYDYLMKTSAKGNPLAALREMWYDGGDLVDAPEQLEEIYKLAGYPYQISQETAPWYTRHGVLTGQALLKNPLVTSNFEEIKSKVIPELRKAFKGDKTRLKQYGADAWDKNTRYTPNDWVNELENDVNSGANSGVYTSIPDKVTEALKSLGYDGIVDMVGKGGGEGHTVTIPLYPYQVRSKFAAFDPYQRYNANLLASKKVGTSTNTHTTTSLKTAMQQVMDKEYGKNDIINKLPNRVKRLINSGNLVIVNSSNNIPGVIGDELIEGAYDEYKDIIYLVANRLNDDNFNSVLNHELYHRAENTDSKLKLQIANINKSIQRIFDLAEKGVGSDIAKTAYKRAINNAKPEDQLNEFKAYIVSEYSKKPESFTGFLLKIMQSLYSHVKIALMRSGVSIDNINESDLASISYYGISSGKFIKNSFVMNTLKQGYFTPSHSFIKQFNSFLDSAFILNDRETTLFKSDTNTGVIDFKNFTDLLESHSFKTHGFSGLDIKSQRMMLLSMNRMIKDSKIRNIIVKLIPVNMMNIFTSKEFSAKVLLHNKSMLKNSDSVDINSSISAMNAATSVLMQLTASVTAQNRLTGINLVNSPDNFFTALGARFGNSSSFFTFNGAKELSRLTLRNINRFSGNGDTTSGTINDRHGVTPISNIMLGDNAVDAALSPSIISKNEKESGNLLASKKESVPTYYSDTDKQALESLFKDISPRAKPATREAAQDRINDFKDSDKIRYVEENFYDILGSLEESGKVVIKC